MSPARRVSIIGSGNWGSAIAKIIGNNVAQMPEKFVSEVQMYVYEEIVNGRKLTEIINKEHENVKYLPKHKLPTNVVAVADAKETAANADILVFVIPHQFVQRICKLLKGNIKKGALGISLIKGFDLQEHGGIELISNVIGTELEIQCAVLMGANIANEVAAESFCEATIGCKNKENGLILKEIFQTDYFRLVCVEDTQTVEVCGALKNIVAVGAGFADGLGYGDNTKAAVIRLGFMEIVKFCEVFYQGSCMATFLESCGLADLVTTCYGGRNRKVSEAFAKSGKTIEQLEAEMLNGQKLQGPATAQEVYSLLKSKNMLDRFPMFTAVHQICKGELSVTDFIECLKNHPEHM